MHVHLMHESLRCMRLHFVLFSSPLSIFDTERDMESLSADKQTARSTKPVRSPRIMTEVSSRGKAFQATVTVSSPPSHTTSLPR